MIHHLGECSLSIVSKEESIDTSNNYLPDESEDYEYFCAFLYHLVINKVGSYQGK